MVQDQLEVLVQQEVRVALVELEEQEGLAALVELVVQEVMNVILGFWKGGNFVYTYFIFMGKVFSLIKAKCDLIRILCIL